MMKDNCHNDYDYFVFNRYPLEPCPHYIMPTEYTAHCCGEPCYHALPRYNGFGVISKKFINDVVVDTYDRFRKSVRPICSGKVDRNVDKVLYGKNSCCNGICNDDLDRLFE